MVDIKNSYKLVPIYILKIKTSHHLLLLILFYLHSVCVSVGLQCILITLSSPPHGDPRQQQLLAGH